MISTEPNERLRDSKSQNLNLRNQLRVLRNKIQMDKKIYMYVYIYIYMISKESYERLRDSKSQNLNLRNQLRVLRNKIQMDKKMKHKSPVDPIIKDYSRIQLKL